MKERIGQKIKLTSYEDLMGVGNEESAVDVNINEIHSFENTPFKVQDDERMQELVESIRVNGVLTPVLIRPSKKTRGYEMISGHRRMHAATLAGLTVIPAIVRDMDDDTAVLAMVDANIQREELLPSEKAFAYKMKMDAMRHQGKTNGDGTSAQFGRKLETADLVGKEVGESRMQVRRYIRLTELTTELLDFVDKKRLQFTLAVDISYLDKEIQNWLYEYICENGVVKAKQIIALREACASGLMTQAKMISILNANQPGKTPSKKFSIPEKKLREYFPAGYSSDDMRDIILGLLDEWKSREA